MTEETNHKPTPPRTERIGKYEILDHIATGGMGVIYKARDVDLDRVVALKILPPDMASQQTTLIRFQREAKAAAQLRHENIVSIFDVGESEGTYYLALEYVEGADLQDYITRNCKLDPEEARQIMIQATRALVHAHEQGIVHRDIKPSNLLLTRKGDRLVVKLTDFGLAIRYENDAEFRITKDKTTVGTVDYMSPEQARDSRAADIRSDIYSLGCTFFHMLAGQAPFAKGTLSERIIQHMKVLPPDVRKYNKSVPEAFVVIINRMLAKKPDDRYQTPAELLIDLENPERVAPAAKNGKPTEKSARKREPTQVIDQPDVDGDIEEPKQVKVSRLRKRTPAREEDKAKDIDDPIEETHDEDATADEKRPAIKGAGNKKSEDQRTPVWMIVTGASVGVLALVLILAVALGGRTPPVVKDVDRPMPPPTPAKKQPNIEPPPPVVKIDTSPAKMTVRLPELPTIDGTPSPADVPALLREFRGPFTKFPEAPKDAPILRVGRLIMPGPQAFRTLGEAFAAAVENEFTIIEVADGGPIFVPSVPALSQRTIWLRGGDGYRPLIVWDVPNRAAPEKTPTALCALSQGKLILDNIDFAARWTGDAPAALFDLPGADLYARECTFSVAGKSKDGLAVVRRVRTPQSSDGRATQSWFKRCYVRGSDAILLRMHESTGDVLLDESLIVGDQHPLIDLRGKATDSFGLYSVRSSLVAGQVMLRWQGGPGVNAPITVKMLDSIVSCDDLTSSQGDMVQVADSGLATMRWRGVNCVYAGWKQLVKADSKSIGGTDLPGWRGQWGNASGEAAVARPWPAVPPSALEDQPASTFLPGESPVAHVALSGAGSIGGVIGWLPTPPDAWLERTLEPRVVAGIPIAEIDPPAIPFAKDNLYHGERIDLAKSPDLGAHINLVLQREKARLGPRLVFHIAGRGVAPTSPVRFSGIQEVVLFFERDLKSPITLVPNPNPDATLKRSPLLEITGGHLEIIGARMRLDAGTLVPTLVRAEDANLTLTRCWLQGPHVKATDGFVSLIAVANTSDQPATLLLRDNVMVAAKLLMSVHDHVQLKARNNVFLALADGIQFDARNLSAPVVHVLDHNTLAARMAFFSLRTGLEPSGPGSILLHANSNAFLFPFANDADRSALVRGIDAWMLRGRFAWQGRNNVYDARMHAYVGLPERAVVAKQTRVGWQAMWGQSGEQGSLLLADPKAFKTIAVEAGPSTAVLSQLDRLVLPIELRGDLRQAPPGADLAMLLGLKKKSP
ncbi:MAG: serine/threonine protein kinase [Planctomycetes bacterium]|nr:serine/threonine protein kinase [Planctomycetota bacterium]